MASKVAVELVPNIVSAVSSTMTPFLFQTRTLATLQRGRSVVRSYGARRTFIGSSIRNVRVDRKETTSHNPVHDENNGPPIRWVMSEPAEPAISGDIDVSSHGSQNTKRMLQASMSESVYEFDGDQVPDRPWDTVKGRKNGSAATDVKDFYDIEDEFSDDEAEADPWTRQNHRSQDQQTTITASERAAFEAIFKNIKSKAENVRRYGAVRARKNDDNARWESQNILGEIMGTSRVDRFPQTQDEMEKVVNRYPPSLRASAANAVGLGYDESRFEEIPQKEDVMDVDQLEELRQPIRDGVEARMRAAATDADLWEVMEEEVFPLIGKLGLGEAVKEKDVKRSGRKGRKPAIATKDKARKSVLSQEDARTIQFEPIVHEGNEVSPLALYGPLYPAYLLLGLRLLDRSFAKSSPLTLSILPKIKSLGLMSHVLGASTQLYNELLIVHWYRYDDFRGVINLLKEMEESGLVFDKETLHIVDDIRGRQRMVMEGNKGPILMELWKMPEFAPGAFEPWQRKIETMLEEKEKEIPAELRI